MDGIEEMLKGYECDYQIGMETDIIADAIYEYIAGYSQISGIFFRGLWYVEARMGIWTGQMWLLINLGNSILLKCRYMVEKHMKGKG